MFCFAEQEAIAVEDLNSPVDMATHIRDTKESLAEIENDIHCLMDMEKEEAKDMTEGFDSGMLAGLLSKQGVDPGIVAMLNDCRKDGNWGDGGMLIVLFLILILGFGGNGGWFGNRNEAGAAEAAGIDRTIFNQSNFENLANAISTQGTRQEMAINSLANNLNCDVNSIKNALCGLDKQLAVNQGSVVNAIQSCCCNIQNKIQECCCQTNLNVERGFCGVNSNIQSLSYQMQTADAATRQLIQQQFCDQNAYLAQQFCDIKSREDAREIQALRDQVQALREDRNTALILNAVANKDTIAYTGTISGSTVSGSGTLS